MVDIAGHRHAVRTLVLCLLAIALVACGRGWEAAAGSDTAGSGSGAAPARATITRTPIPPASPEVAALITAIDEARWLSDMWGPFDELAALGPGAAAAIPALLATLPRLHEGTTADAGTFDRCAKVLAATGPIVVSYAIDACASSDEHVRRGALLTLVHLHAAGHLAPVAEHVAAAVLPRTTDARPVLRTLAAKLLGDLAVGSPAITTALVALMDDDDEPLRIASARALGLLGRRMPAARELLLRDLRDRKSRRSLAAAFGLGALGDTAPPEVVSALLDASDAPYSIGHAADAALGAIGFPAAAACLDRLHGATGDALTRGLDHAQLFMSIYEEAGWKALVACCKDPRASMRTVALRVVLVNRRTNGQNAEFTALLPALLADADVEVRRAVARALSSHDGYRWMLEPALVATRDADAGVRALGVLSLSATLSSRDPDNAELARAASTAIALFDDPIESVRQAAQQAFGDAERAFPALVARIERGEPVVGLVCALRALGEPRYRSFSDKDKVVPLLIPLIESSDATVQEVATSALVGWAHDERHVAAAWPVALRVAKRVAERAGAPRHGTDSRLNDLLGIIGRAGPLATSAVPWLLTLDDGANGYIAQGVLGQIGDSAMAPLVAALEGPSAELAARCLGGFGTKAVPALADALAHPSQAVRRMAVEALASAVAHVHSPPPELIATIENDVTPRLLLGIDDAEDGDAFGRPLQSCVRWCPRIAPKVRAAFEGCTPAGQARLVAILSDAPADEGTAKLLVQASTSPDVGVRRAAVRALRNAGPPQVAIAALINALVDADRDVADQAWFSLGGLARRHDFAADLTPLLTHARPSVRQRAVNVLGQLTAYPDAVIPRLADVARTDADAEVAESARQLLEGSFGPAGREAARQIPRRR